MNGDQIRDSFIRFFEGKGHQHMPSASLIPAGDPTLLFTSVGLAAKLVMFTRSFCSAYCLAFSILPIMLESINTSYLTDSGRGLCAKNSRPSIKSYGRK